MNRLGPAVAVSVMGVMALVAGAHADVTYTAQTRQVRGHIIGTMGTALRDQTITAPDFEVFDAEVNFFYSSGLCQADVSQHSELLPDGMSAHGALTVNDGSQVYGGEADNIFDVTFTLAAPAAYSLQGDWEVELDSPQVDSPFARVALTGDGGTFFQSEYIAHSPSSSNPFDQSGILPAGTYRMEAHIYARAQGGPIPSFYSRSLSFAVALQFSCVADLNGDGMVDFGDYLEFLNLYDAQDLRVDFNGDDMVDFSDYLEFLNLYEQGC